MIHVRVKKKWRVGYDARLLQIMMILFIIQTAMINALLIKEKHVMIACTV